MHYLISLIIPLASLLLQSYPRFFNKHFGVDVWTRLLEIEHVKRAHHKIPKKIKKGFIIEGDFDYPIIFPWIFSFFPKKFLLSVQGFVSPFFDSLQNVLVFYITFSLTGSLGASLLAQTMYSLIPIIPIENSYLTPRSLGYLNFTLAFYPLLLFHINHNMILLIFSLFFTCTLFLTHRFALQSLIFISAFFTIVDHSFIYLLNLVLGLLIILVLTKGFYLRVLKGHLYNIYFWVVNYKYRFSHQIYGLKSAKKKDWVEKIYSLLSFFSPIFLFAVNVWAFFGIVYIFLYTQKTLSLPTNSIYSKMGLWVIFFYIFGSIVLKIKRLIPIGEGQRYMEMATVPSVVLSSVIFIYFIDKYGIIAEILLALLILGNLSFILFVQVKGIITDKNRSLTPELQEMYRFINSLKGNPRIICIPHQITTMTVYNTKADVLVNADNQGLMQIQEIYPVLKKSIPFLQKKYSLSHLLLRESFAKLSDLHLKSPKIIFRSGDIVLIKLK